jgi:hypothetical protein
MKREYVWIAAAGFAMLTGCRHVEQSPIVTAFHNAGGGDIDQSTPDSISQFLAKHEDVRKEITPLCAQKKANAPADWATTDEGKVCDGNTRANFFGKAVIKSDGVKF